MSIKLKLWRFWRRLQRSIEQGGKDMGKIIVELIESIPGLADNKTVICGVLLLLAGALVLVAALTGIISTDEAKPFVLELIGAITAILGTTVLSMRRAQTKTMNSIEALAKAQGLSNQYQYEKERIQ